MNVFNTWEEASDFAWKRMQDTKRPQGIEQIGQLIGPQGWKVTFLPGKDKRFGHDARIEAIEVY